MTMMPDLNDTKSISSLLMLHTGSSSFSLSRPLFLSPSLSLSLSLPLSCLPSRVSMDWIIIIMTIDNNKIMIIDLHTL